MQFQTTITFQRDRRAAQRPSRRSARRGGRRPVAERKAEDASALPSTSSAVFRLSREAAPPPSAGAPASARRSASQARSTGPALRMQVRAMPWPSFVILAMPPAIVTCGEREGGSGAGMFSMPPAKSPHGRSAPGPAGRRAPAPRPPGRRSRWPSSTWASPPAPDRDVDAAVDSSGIQAPAGIGHHDPRSA